ncbi:hypothetical protein EA187_18510 [Lujinxingia sediminis]|uniref:PQQ-binding-like beta-propeller repeat protein n=1 Tax=Lujinxingia sediminis TaxID=2480984 RepID=A0ABY0CND9_9DELT|nr:hypothetical protein [Lujinxingia sediminis]RVU41467.1 hypothetical protein EA187_18510 [Lujinxingia sediminis]
MKFNIWALAALGALMITTGCEGEEPAPDPIVEHGELRLERVFPTDTHPGQEFESCVFASPMHYHDGAQDWVLAMTGEGQLAAHDVATGEVAWSVELPAPEGEGVFALAQPAWLDDSRLVVAYHTVPADHEAPYDANVQRLSHRVVVVDLAQRAISSEFEPLTLEATLPANDDATLSFRPERALSRGDVVIGRPAGATLGRAYITLGNTRDIQPWHGWAFEIDLDAWADQGAGEAIHAVFNTTPEPDENCGPEGTSGSRERRCGGGLWAPTGPLLVEEEGGGYHLIVGAGNGQLNLDRQDYANTLLRLGPGLSFEPMCDAEACADFNPDAPSLECVESCQDLFIPRLLAGQAPPRPADGRCTDEMTLFECWQEMDYIGGSTPARVELGEGAVLVYPTKDGHAYLVDAEHMGTMHDRHKLVDLCGTADDACRKTWAGMAVTQPLIMTTEEGPLALIPTFMPDSTHAAGVVALAIVDTEDGPRFERRWEFPTFDKAEAITRFREHPGRVVAAPLKEGGEPVAWLVEVGDPGATGRLIALDPLTGEALFDADLAGRGQRYTWPLRVDDRIFVSSCPSDRAASRLEGYQLVPVD